MIYGVQAVVQKEIFSLHFHLHFLSVGHFFSGLSNHYEDDRVDEELRII